MSLAPALLKDNLGVIWVEIHVHASIAVVDVAYLSSAGLIDRRPGKQSKSLVTEISTLVYCLLTLVGGITET